MHLVGFVTKRLNPLFDCINIRPISVEFLIGQAEVEFYFSKIRGICKKPGTVVTLETTRVLKCCAVVERQPARNFR